MPSHPNDERESPPLRCRNPASPGIPFLGLKVLFGAESSAVVRLSVSGAVSIACYSAGALALGARLGGNEQVWDAADLLVQRVLVRDETAMRELVDAVLTPLTGARGGAESLLRTLEAYFATGGNASLAARSLHLSVRALTYRLEKVADLTRRDPTDPAQRFELQTAVTGARLLGWPDFE